MSLIMSRRGARASSRRRMAAAPPTPPALRTGSGSGSTTGTTATVNLPTDWQPGDYILLLVNSNTSQPITFTTRVDSAVLLGNAGNYLQAWRIVPTAGSVSIVFTVPVSAVLRWWVGAWQNVDSAAVVSSAASNLGNNTTATIEVPVVDLDYISTGYEVAVWAGGVNSSATWTTIGSTVFATTSGNAALAVRAAQIAAGQLAVVSSSFDRGLAGTTRNESALVLILQPVQSPQRSMLINGSFEVAGGNGVATNWEIEGTAPRLPTCSLSTTGVIDGNHSQRFQFTGQTGDSGNVAIYQSPISVNPGDVLQATIYLSGTITNVYAIFGIEGFVAPGGAYISEHDTTINEGVLTSTPTKFAVEYTCPANCTAVAVYFQTPGLVPTSVVDVNLDKAILAKI